MTNNNPTSLSPPLSDEDARTMAEAYGVPLAALAAYEKGRYHAFLEKREVEDSPESIVHFRRIELHLAKCYPLLLRSKREEGEHDLYDLARNPPHPEEDRAWIAKQLAEAPTDDGGPRTIVGYGWPAELLARTLVDPGDPKGDQTVRQVVCITPRSHAFKYVEAQIRELMCDVSLLYGGTWTLDPVALGDIVSGQTLLEAVDKLQAQANGKPYESTVEAEDDLPVEARAAYQHVRDLETRLDQAERDLERLAFVEEQLKQLEAATCEGCGRVGSVQSAGELSLCAQCREPERRRPFLFSERENARKAAEKAHRDYQEYAAARMAAREPVQTYWSYVVNAACKALEGET